MVIDKKINAYVVYRILKHEGYDFVKQKKLIKESVNSICDADYESMITDVIIQTQTFNSRSIGNDIMNEMKTIGFTRRQGLRILAKYIAKYNLRKYYKKVTEWHLQQDSVYPYHIYLINTENVKNKMLELCIVDTYCDYTPIAYRKISHSLNTDISDALANITHQQKNVIYAYQYHVMRQFWEKHSDRAFTIKKNGDMTYTPKGKKLYIQDGLWKKTNRIKIKYGKGIRKIFEPILDIVPDNVTEQICNHLKAKYTFTFELKVVEGDDIRYYYHGQQTHPTANTGSLSQSCMRYDKCQDYFGIYVDNPNQIKMLIAIDKNKKLHGRALLWENLINTDDSSSFKAMDRIYGNDMVIEKFKEWGHENGYAVKNRQSYQDKKLVAPNGSIIENYQTDQLVNQTDDYPYMDTLKYTDTIDESTIILSSNNGYIALESTSGYAEDDTYVTLSCGDRCHEDDACYDEINDQYYHTDEATWCEEDQTYCYYDDAIPCNDQYYHPDSELIVYSDYDNEYLIKDDAIYSEHYNAYIHEEYAIECDVCGWIHIDESQEIIVTSDDTDNTNLHGTYDVHDSIGLIELIEHLER
jgi:hypothetical protein